MSVGISASKTNPFLEPRGWYAVDVIGWPDDWPPCPTEPDYPAHTDYAIEWTSEYGKPWRDIIQGYRLHRYIGDGTWAPTQETPA